MLRLIFAPAYPWEKVGMGNYRTEMEHAKRELKALLYSDGAQREYFGNL